MMRRVWPPLRSYKPGVAGSKPAPPTNEITGFSHCSGSCGSGCAQFCASSISASEFSKVRIASSFGSRPDALSRENMEPGNRAATRPKRRGVSSAGVIGRSNPGNHANREQGSQLGMASRAALVLPFLAAPQGAGGDGRSEGSDCGSCRGFDYNQ